MSSSDLNQNPYLPQIVKLAALARTLTPRRKILALLATWAIDGLSDLNKSVLLGATCPASSVPFIDRRHEKRHDVGLGEPLTFHDLEVNCKYGF